MVERGRPFPRSTETRIYIVPLSLIIYRHKLLPVVVHALSDPVLRQLCVPLWSARHLEEHEQCRAVVPVLPPLYAVVASALPSIVRIKSFSCDTVQLSCHLCPPILIAQPQHAHVLRHGVELGGAWLADLQDCPCL